MTQLVYHPAFDPYQAIIRIVRLLLAVNQPLDLTTLRILEFYLIFPEKITEVRLTTKLRADLRDVPTIARYPYDRLPQSALLFDRMEPSFDAALQTLASNHMIESGGEDTVTLAEGAIGTQTLSIAEKRNLDESELIGFIARISDEFSALGKGGLKHRTGLAEFKYDAA